MTGGDGTNVFVYSNGDGNDVITDYKNGDTIKLLSGSVKNAAVTKNNDYVLTIGNDKITVKGAAEKYLLVVDANDNERWYPEPPPSPVILTRTSIKLTEGFFDDSMNVNTYTEAAHFKKTIVTIDASAVQHDVYLVGNSLANIITGTDQDDIINGGSGKDTINAGADNDLINGGKGADTFVYNASTDGKDIIADFSRGDKIRAILSYNDKVSGTSSRNGDVTFNFESVTGNLLLKTAMARLFNLLTVLAILYKTVLITDSSSIKTKILH